MSAREEMLTLINSFLSGQDRSQQLVGRIEALAIREFLDTEVFELLAEPLSLYRPGFSSPYVDEDELAMTLEEARQALTEEDSG